MAKDPEKKKKKSKKSVDSEGKVDEGPTYEDRIRFLSPISKPLAGKKLTVNLHTLTKKAAAAKLLKRGVKEVVKSLKKNQKGICIIAGDISPIDVISHVSVFCEEKEIPYIYVPSRVDLGLASSTKRPTSVVLIQNKAGSAFDDLYNELYAEVKKSAMF
jgi:H/ACA ribonucleoprotein complex subunit 2